MFFRYGAVCAIETQTIDCHTQVSDSVITTGKIFACHDSQSIV